ncbi:olfactory receptor 11L1-like [Rhinatrema bivittatum]|uniref:olfactory receptor 11L1-like n=1 Tax=Rhinatrema bivittatum TaxID=194408 RepID=UPI00112A01C9|nr:olfactory receptor 11L1-like [Rhinatrema bivittatum]
MNTSDHNATTEFVILGLVNSQQTQILLFLVFLCIYCLTIMGNIVIITVVKLDHGLHTPMYFFLSNLSFLEIWYTTTIVPKMLANFLSISQTISFSSCMTQLYCFVCLGATECYLLSVMGYDRYLAICAPLHYPARMNSTACFRLALGSWVCGILTGLLPVMLISRLEFCGSNYINHFYCDIPPLLSLSCTDTFAAEITIFMLSFFVLLCCFLLTVVSYIFILFSILKIPSTTGRQRAFSTCGSHLIVVVIYYGTMIFMYVRPSSSYSSNLNKAVSVFYTVVTPMLNPVIYSLRNKDVKNATKKLVHKCFFS